MNITIDFNYFLNIQLGEKDFVQIPFHYGELIQAIDSQHVYCYVQFKSWDETIIYKSPYLWRIKSYLASYDKWQLDKERSARERREWNLLHENTNRMIKRMRVVSGVSDDEVFRKLASKCSMNKLQEIFNVMGAELEL